MSTDIIPHEAASEAQSALHTALANVLAQHAGVVKLGAMVPVLTRLLVDAALQTTGYEEPDKTIELLRQYIESDAMLILANRVEHQPDTIN